MLYSYFYIYFYYFLYYLFLLYYIQKKKKKISYFLKKITLKINKLLISLKIYKRETGFSHIALKFFNQFAPTAPSTAR